ncbi:MAG: DEAD/DEAH box helicase [Planctomycetes bacterium]|nr:DEAD/DEAH box helicase [Planctomycetota bacterium]
MGDEQKAVKTTAFDLQLNPASPGMSFHKLDRAKDKNFWSVRVNADIRLIVHKTPGSLLLCYVDHHDKAYAWAERRKLETHPTTGAAQLVEIRETFKEILIPVYVEPPAAAAQKRRPFANFTDSDLLKYGVPSEWLADVRGADEDSLLALADRLPAEASEALLELATGGTPRMAEVVVDAAGPFSHPDAQRRFRIMANVEELTRALDYPWDKWTVFLHPEQRHIAEGSFGGPARVSGSAGTGKTIVALHRAVYLAHADNDARILLTTFSDVLANALRGQLRRLIGNEPRLGERIDIDSIGAIGSRLYKANVGHAKLAKREAIIQAVKDAAAAVPKHKFALSFLLTEWDQVVDAWQLGTWESYRDMIRLGRKMRLPETQRVLLWSIFERVRTALVAQKLVTQAEMFTQLAAALAKSTARPFDHVIVDEAQDIGVAHLRFLAALASKRADALFFAGDLGQRIFQQPFSWLALGVDVRGRSKTLRVNYRTSHQIRTQADRLLGPTVSDADGNREERTQTVSVFNGQVPTVCVFENDGEEAAHVGAWVAERAKEGVTPHEIAVFVRSPAQIPRAIEALKQAGMNHTVLDEGVEIASGAVSVSTMHLAKGLEFRAVAVMACDDEVIPLQERVETAGEDSDLKDVYDTERHLLYVASTRARDYLLVTGVKPGSEFLDDLRP